MVRWDSDQTRRGLCVGVVLAKHPDPILALTFSGFLLGKLLGMQFLRIVALDIANRLWMSESVSRTWM
jgi:hypothetical protein